MRKYRYVFLTLALLVSMAPRTVWALGQEAFGRRYPIGNYTEWPGLSAAVDDDSRIYSRWVNGGEMFYFRGGITKLNSALERFSKVETPAHEVFLLPGPGHATTFDNRKIRCDWMVELLGGISKVELTWKGAAEVLPASPRLRIYFGEDTKLEELKVPRSISLVGPEELKRRYVHTIETADPQVRSQVAHMLAELEPYSPEAAKRIADLLEFPDNYARAGAAFALGTMGAAARGTLPALKKALADAGYYGEIYEKAIDKIAKAPRIDKAKAKARRALAKKIEAFLRRQK